MTSPYAYSVDPVDKASDTIIAAWQRAHQVAVREMEAAARAANVDKATGTAVLRAARSVKALDAVQLAMVKAGVQSKAAASPLARTMSEQAIARTEAWFEGSAHSFMQPNPGAIDAIVNRTQGRMVSGFRALTASADEAMRDALVQAVSNGENPAVAARNMIARTDGIFGGGVARAVTIARTEIIDANRMSSHLTYRDNSDVILGWRWLSALTARTCAACWAMHNSIHEMDEFQIGHPNCRCTPVPILDDDDTMGDLGNPEVAFRKLTEGTQRKIMGNARYDAWKGGDVSLRDLAGVRDNPGWRKSIQITPIRDLGKVKGPVDATLPRLVPEPTSLPGGLLERGKLYGADHTGTNMMNGDFDKVDVYGAEPMKFKANGHAYLNKEHSLDWESMTDEQRDALSVYTGVNPTVAGDSVGLAAGEFTTEAARKAQAFNGRDDLINNWLRAGDDGRLRSVGLELGPRVGDIDGAAEVARKLVDDIDSTMVPLSKEITVKRRSYANGLVRYAPTGQNDGGSAGIDYSTLVGQIVEDPGYVSTTTGNTAANFGNIEFRIKVPAGTRGVWINDTPVSYADEKEFLLGRGTQYRITRVVDDGKKGVLVEAEVIGQHQVREATAKLREVMTKEGVAQRRLAEVNAALANIDPPRTTGLGTALEMAAMKIEGAFYENVRWLMRELRKEGIRPGTDAWSTSFNQLSRGVLAEDRETAAKITAAFKKMGIEVPWWPPKKPS